MINFDAEVSIGNHRREAPVEIALQPLGDKSESLAPNRLPCFFDLPLVARADEIIQALPESIEAGILAAHGRLGERLLRFLRHRVRDDADRSQRFLRNDQKEAAADDPFAIGELFDLLKRQRDATMEDAILIDAKTA